MKKPLSIYQRVFNILKGAILNLKSQDNAQGNFFLPKQ